MSQADQLAAIDELLKPPGPPERIYNWRDSQLSLARHYGGIKYQGHEYAIAYNEQDQPLVRWDVIKREAKEKKAAATKQKQSAKDTQAGLI